MVNNKKILIVDDSKAFQQLERQLLAGHGCDLIDASDGATAIKLAIEQQPDIILMDVQMPVMDGVQALQILRKDARTQKIPIVMVTTMGREQDKHLLLTGGATAVLSKPLQARELNALVRKLLAGEA